MRTPELTSYRIDLVAKNPETSGWDIEMLRDTAKLIELERTQPVLRVA